MEIKKKYRTYPYFVVHIDNKEKCIVNIEELVRYVTSLPKRLYPIYIQCINSRNNSECLVSSTTIEYEDTNSGSEIVFDLLTFIEFCMEFITSQACDVVDENGEIIKQVCDFTLNMFSLGKLSCTLILLPSQEKINLDTIFDINKIDNSVLLYAKVLYNRMKNAPIGVK